MVQIFIEKYMEKSPQGPGSAVGPALPRKEDSCADYEKYKDKLTEDNKVFIEGRVNVREDENGKLVCTKVDAFDEIPRVCWIQFSNKQAYLDAQPELDRIIAASDGNDLVTIYCREERQRKVLPKSQSIQAQGDTLKQLIQRFGEENVKVV